MVFELVLLVFELTNEGSILQLSRYAIGFGKTSAARFHLRENINTNFRLSRLN